MEGERWQTQRRMLAPIFARRTVNSFAAAMLNVAEQLADEWTRLGNGAVLDIAAEMTLITLNVLAATIFSFRSAMNAYLGVIGRIGALDLLGLPPAIPRPGARALATDDGVLRKHHR